uniref:BRCT domain-containing protein n=1 Tax=Daphnia galeata TaxID=27404 RepID=A0A8J2RIN3_9CRUS|nr:unnamed protein product [Daphnia galeata]
MEVLNNQLCTKIFCVLPASSSEITYTEDLISAKNCCQRHKLNVVCILENDCLKLTPSKECVFVLTDFDSPLFEFLLSFECKVVGPQCLLNSLKNGQPIPSTAVFNLAMKGIVVTTTGLTMQEKKEAEKKIQFMGGIYTSNLTSSTTHLIAKSVADFGLKFKSARSRAIPIMLPKWIDEVWSARISQEIVHGNDPEYSSYVCPVFQGFFVCASRISIKERKSIKKMVEANGGKYCPQLIEGETNVLITTSSEGEKYLYARSWKIFCLKPEWVQNSLDQGYVCDPERFTVKKITKLPPKCSSSEENKLPVADFHYASINSTIFNNSTKELDETSTNGSTSPLNQLCELQSTEPLECLDLVLSLKAGRFLKGFKIFPSGFDGPQMEKLRRVLKNAGAIQLNAINDESISHVIVGKSVKKDWKQLQHLDIKPHVVTLQWLTRSLQLKAPAPEAEYYPTDFENLSTPNRKKSFFQDTSSELPSVTTNVSLDDVRTTVQYSTLSQKTYVSNF